ncbi:hypothetical protein ACEQPO_16495 [Bacillus sp. SL00103]
MIASLDDPYSTYMDQRKPKDLTTPFLHHLKELVRK